MTIPGPTATKSIRKKPKKDFRVWDGEGHDFPDGSHRMTLLANSDGEYIENAEGLSTRACVDFLIRKRPRAYDVWFSFGYDVNKIVTDLPLHTPEFGGRGSMENLWKNGRTWWHHTYFKYIPRKFLTVRYKGDTHTSTDTFSFFQESFLKSCEKWGIDASEIVKGKEARGTFDTWSLDEIRDYNFKELSLAKRLLEALRDSFTGADLVPQSWHGPGAIATTWLRRENISVHYKELPQDLERTVKFGFFGGRIDVASIGEVEAYQYDLASAYPKGLTDCLSLAPIEWKHSYDTTRDDRHALYRVLWETNESWNPFPWRAKNGGVLYPPAGEGWFWGIEVLAAEHCFPGGVRRLEAWYPEGERLYPFKTPIYRDYHHRAELKREKHPSHMAIRLGLNSLYGKLCQHVGGGPNGGRPRWQNYVWAGYATAWTRAKILRAVAKLGAENVIAIATDGIFSRIPLEPEQPELGAWEDKGLATTLFVAPGLYAMFHDDKPTVVKMRGMPSNLNYGWVLRQWGCTTKLDCPGENTMSSHFTSFIGMGKALTQDVPHGVFLEQERHMNNVCLVGTSKRIPQPDAFAPKKWKEFPLAARRRTEPVISYPYTWRGDDYDPKEEKE